MLILPGTQGKLGGTWHPLPKIPLPNKLLWASRKCKDCFRCCGGTDEYHSVLPFKKPVIIFNTISCPTLSFTLVYQPHWFEWGSHWFCSSHQSSPMSLHPLRVPGSGHWHQVYVALELQIYIFSLCNKEKSQCPKHGSKRVLCSDDPKSPVQFLLTPPAEPWATAIQAF
jgi:hypothetical protein